MDPRSRVKLLPHRDRVVPTLRRLAVVVDDCVERGVSHAIDVSKERNVPPKSWYRTSLPILFVGAIISSLISNSVPYPMLFPLFCTPPTLSYKKRLRWRMRTGGNVSR